MSTTATSLVNRATYPPSTSDSTIPLSGPSEEKSPRVQPRIVPSKDIGSKIIPAALLLVACFWINMAHLFGAFYLQENHTSRVHVPVVDFDGGALGQALIAAANSVSATKGHPTYFVLDPTSTSLEELIRDVFKGRYWTALVAQEGATERWTAATSGASTSYEPSEVFAHITLTARYWAFYQGNFFSTSLGTLGRAAGIFSSQVAAPALATATSLNNDVARSAYLTPAVSSEIFAAGRDFSASNRALLNTIGTVMPVLMLFFFTMAFNGISGGIHLYAAFNTRHHVLWRLVISSLWPLIASLCSVGWSTAFMGNYDLSAQNFFAYWAVTWVFCIINLDLLDTLTAHIPMQFVPFFILTWIITNVCASLAPPPLLHPWFAVNYFFPASHWWSTCITILTGGGVNYLKYNLPVLAAWLIIAKVASLHATTKRVRLGVAAYARDPKPVEH